MQLKDLKIITGWDDNSNITIIHRVNGIRKVMTIKNFQWYFTIPYHEYEQIGSSFFEYFFEQGIINKLTKKGKYLKIYANKIFQQNVTLFSLINALKKKNVSIFESDLSLLSRFIIDNQIAIETQLKILYIDIETDDSNDGIEIGRDTILSWAAHDDNKNIFYECCQEKELLEKFIDLISQYDVISGWNSVQFDIPYIKERMQKYGIQYNWRKIIHVDMMQRCIKLYSYDMDKIGLKGFSLNEISRVFLKEQKVEHTESILEMYQNNPDKLKKYNIQDVALLYKLNTKLNILELMIKECEWTHTLLNKFYIGELLDNYILSEAQRKNIRLPSKPSKTTIEQNKKLKIIGGYVKKPIPGLYSNMRVLDYSSLYPSIIVGWNIGYDVFDEALSKQGDVTFQKFVGPDRKIEDVEFTEWNTFLQSEKKRLDSTNAYYQTANNNYFKRIPNGFISSLLKDLLDKRKQIKKNLVNVKLGSAEYGRIQSTQSIIKEMSNSIYGIHADRNARYFNKNIAESITLTGQYLNKLSANVLENRHFSVIYADTDSIFLVLPKSIDITQLVIDVNNDLSTFLEKYFQLTDNIVYLGDDKMYKKVIILDKKRYTGILGWKDNQATHFLFSRGTEDVKRNTIKLAKKYFIRLLVMILEENVSLKDVKIWLASIKKYVLTSNDITVDDLTISAKVSKAINSYKSKPVHVRLAERLIQEKKILDITESKRGWGTRIEYIVTESIDSQEAILAEEFDGHWDRQYYWDVQVYAPIMRILKVVWPKQNWEEHSIILFEKAERKKEKEKKKIQNAKDKERKKKERAKLKIVRDKRKIQQEKERDKRKMKRIKEREKKQKEKEKIKLQKEKLKNQKELKQRNEIY